MRLSTSTNILDTIPDGAKSRIDLMDSLQMCNKAGFQVFDMNFCDNGLGGGFMMSDDWESIIDQIKDECEELGISFSQSHLEFYDVCNTGISQHEWREELVRRGLIASGKLGVKWAVLHLGSIYDEGGYSASKSKKCNMEYIKKHLETAAANHVGIAVENLPDKARRRFCGVPEELIDFVDSIHTPELGICWDFGHGNLMKIDQAYWVRQIGYRLKAVHVADNHGEWDEHIAPFYGNICWKDMVHALKEINYPYDFTYEIHNMTKALPLALRFKQLEHLVDIGNYLITL